MQLIHPCPRFVGAQIKVWRKRRGHTQRALSEGSGVKLRHLQEIEGGRVDIKIRTLGVIALGLGLTPHALLMPLTENSEVMCAECRHMLPAKA